MKKMTLKLKKFISRIFEIIKKPVMLMLPGQVAFSLFLSIFPIITLVGFVASAFNVSLANLIEWFGAVLPKDIANLLSIQGSGSGVNIVIFTIFGFFIASNGPESILISSNVLYEEPQDNSIKRRVKSIIMTILLVFMIIAIAVILAFGNQIINFLLNIKSMKIITVTLFNVFKILKWPVMAFFIFFTVKMIYTMLTPSHVKSKTTNLGAIFTTLGWIIVTAIYSYYVVNIADYGIFYGSLSTIIVFIIWIYILSYILVIGIGINSAVYIESKKEQ